MASLGSCQDDAAAVSMKFRNGKETGGQIQLKGYLRSGGAIKAWTKVLTVVMWQKGHFSYLNKKRLEPS